MLQPPLAVVGLMLVSRTWHLLRCCPAQLRSLHERSGGESCGKTSAGDDDTSTTPDHSKPKLILQNEGQKVKLGKTVKENKGGKGQAAGSQATPNSDKNKYSSTVFLPTTAFPMRASATDRELDLMKFSCEKLYRWQAEVKREGGHRVIVHDGPPYANGALHIGHLLNRVLKDVIVRRHILKGNVVSYIPGWDCHGLPIELNALKQLLQKPSAPAPSSAPPHSSSAPPPSPAASPHSPNISVVDVAASPIASKDPRSVRTAAHAMARSTIQQHLGEMKRWHLTFDPNSIYTTMDPQYEAAQLRVFGTMLQKGLVFRGLRPVHWSPSSRTALAEAELEYNDAHTSTAVHVAFDLDVACVSASHAPLIQRFASSGIDLNVPVSFVAWTTTPWTLPGNQALCVHDTFDYAICACAPSGEVGDAVMRKGIVILLASKVDALRVQLGLVGPPLAIASGAELVGLPYIHPMSGLRHRVLHAAFVTADVGTGIVHTAPAHGFDDYDVGVSSGLLCTCVVDDDGRYTEEAGHSLHGKSVLADGASAVMQILQRSGHLLSRSNFVHKCCAPTIAVAPCVAAAPHAPSGILTTGAQSCRSSSARQSRCASTWCAIATAPFHTFGAVVRRSLGATLECCRCA
jgi:isoleucyl-tRNA synthetase